MISVEESSGSTANNVKIDENFIASYLESMKLKYQEDHLESNYNPFGENNIILSMELPQSLGFHIEVEMSLDDIK